MNIQKNKTYRIKEITQNKPQFMNFGLIENTIIKIMDHSQDNRTFYLEIMGFNRKVAISWDLLQQIVLEEIKEEIKDDEENNKE